MTTSQELNQPVVDDAGSLVTPLSIDDVLEKLRDAGHQVRVIGPFSNGHRLIEVDEVAWRKTLVNRPSDWGFPPRLASNG